MCLKRIKQPIIQLARLSGVGLVLAASHAAQANAPVVAIVLQPAPVVAAMSSTNSLCITITYDKNGNRLSQTVGNVATSTTVWGSGTYGCFVWKI